MMQPLPFPEQLKRERLLHNLSQEDLASKLGCSPKAVGRWERGEGLPRAYYRRRICKLFNKNAEEMGLLEEEQMSLSNASTEASSSSPASTVQESALPLPSVEGEGLSPQSNSSVQESTASSQDTSNGASFVPSEAPEPEVERPAQATASKAPPSPWAASTTEDALSSRDTSNRPFLPPGASSIKAVRVASAYEDIVPLITYDVHPKWVVALSWEPGGRRIASAGGDGTVHVWEPGTGRHLQTYRGHESRGVLAKTPFLPTVYAVAWAPHGSRIASAGNGKAVHIWNADTGRTILKYTGHSGLLPDVFALAWSPDGNRIASACSSIGMDQTIHIWDAVTGKTSLYYSTRCGWLPSFSVLALAWAPNGAYIASSCGDKNVRIWDARNGENLTSYTTPADWVRDLAWSPDSKQLAIANGTKADNSIQIWDTITGTVILTYSGHTDSIRNIAWSPNGAYIASASNDKTVRVWSPITGDTLSIYRGHGDCATAVAWSPDGTRIASASNDKTVQIWRPLVSTIESYVRSF